MPLDGKQMFLEKLNELLVWKMFTTLKRKDGISSVHSLSCVRLFVTPWIAAHQASLSITNSRSHSDSCPSSQWCHPAISSSVAPFSSCPQSFPASGYFPVPWEPARNSDPWVSLQTYWISAPLEVGSHEPCFSKFSRWFWYPWEFKKQTGF